MNRQPERHRFPLLFQQVAVVVTTLATLAACGAAPVAAIADEPPRTVQAPAAEAEPDDAPPVSVLAPHPQAAAILMAVGAAAAATAADDPALATDAELADAWARVLLRANPGPFQYVAYEITARGPAGVASHVRGMMGRRDVVTRTELLPKDQLRRLLGKLRDLGALTLAHPPMPPVKAPKPKPGAKVEPPDPLAGPSQSAVPVYELSFRLGGKENTFLVADPYAMADGRYGEFINAIREVSVRTAGDIGYHAPSGPSGQEGYLFIDSVPSARATVDGVLLDRETPILAYTVSPGPHTIVLENARLGLKREYKVRVQSGVTTSLEVDLR